jgi:hypothetical protein
MKLAAAVVRSLQADMQAELRDIERAVATGTRDAGRGLRTELRRQVTSAGLGQRIANIPPAIPGVTALLPGSVVGPPQDLWWPIGFARASGDE